MSSLIDHTRSKIDGLLRTVDGLSAVDFPFADATKLLSIVAEEFNSLRSDLPLDPTAADPGVAKTLCRRALESIQNYLPVLGFISRSSDLEAPVELHGPLLRLTRRAIQSDALLVIFSEWNYSPFTFLFPELAKRGVVLVGMPRSESHNPLIAPLAGHELGHNIWQREGLGASYYSAASKIIVDEMKANWERWKRLLGLENPEQLSDLMGSRYWEMPLTWAVRQCEETFCDLIGLLLFREAYLYAFQYLLAPGDAVRRAFHYPELSDRSKILLEAAKKVGIKVSDEYPEYFDKASLESDELVSQYVSLADTARERLMPDLLEAARKLVEERKLSAYSEAEVEKAKLALDKAVPATGSAGIENILIAAWEHALDLTTFLGKGLPSVKESEKEVVLHELVLKSFEVFEVEQRLAAP